MKIATYWYVTPVRLHRGNSDRSPTCWRGCEEEGTLIHLLWECPTLTTYWSRILDNVDQLFNTQVPCLPMYVVLGLPNPITYPLKSVRGRQMVLALGAALQNILTHWGTSTSPTYTGWLHRIWYILGMEHISASLTSSETSFQKVWNPFLTLLSKELNEITQPKYLTVLRLTDLGKESQPPANA